MKGSLCREEKVKDNVAFRLQLENQIFSKVREAKMLIEPCD